MFNFFKPKPNVILAKGAVSPDLMREIHPINTKSLILKLSGLHCSSCAIDIDLALEELPSVKATTNYAKSETKIEYDPKQTTLNKIHSTIHNLGYSIN